MCPENLITSLQTMHARADGDDKVAIGHAVELIETLSSQVATFKRMASQRFRPSSEKVNPGQTTLAFLQHLLTEQESKKDAGGKADPLPLKPLRKKRSSKVHLLPVEVVDKHPAQDALNCACGCRKHAIGFDTRRSIMFEPARLFMQEERLHKYACRSCQGQVVQGAGTPKLVPGSLASSSLLAHLVVSKVIDSTPTERAGQQLSRHGAQLAPSTLNDWFGQAGEEAAVLMPHVVGDLRQSRLISLDDTPMPTKNMEHPNHIQRGRLWAYLGDTNRIAYCEHSMDWKGTHPARVLEGFAGNIQGDGYGGINRLFGGSIPRVRVGCNDHARRKFVEALKLGDKRAEVVVDLYRLLYDVERRATVAEMTVDERCELRRNESVPVWNELAVAIAALGAAANRKGPLGKAVTYWCNQRATLEVFLGDGRLPISNAHVERLLRTVALMRKNALFIGSPAAGPRYAALLTLAANCTLAGANPFNYFTWLFDQLAEGWPAKRALQLLPAAWVASQQAA